MGITTQMLSRILKTPEKIVTKVAKSTESEIKFMIVLNFDGNVNKMHLQNLGKAKAPGIPTEIIS